MADAYIEMLAIGEVLGVSEAALDSMIKDSKKAMTEENLDDPVCRAVKEHMEQAAGRKLFGPSSEVFEKIKETYSGCVGPLPSTAAAFGKRSIAVHIEFIWRSQRQSEKVNSLRRLHFARYGEMQAFFAFKESLVISARVDDEGFWHKISHHLLLSIFLLVVWQQKYIFPCGIVLTITTEQKRQTLQRITVTSQSLYTTTVFKILTYRGFYGNWVETNYFANGDTIPFRHLYHLERNLSL